MNRYVQIQQTITSMVHQWQPFDHSLFTLLVPFKDYWKKEKYEEFNELYSVVWIDSSSEILSPNWEPI